MNLQKLLEICQFEDFPFDLKPNKSPNVWAGRPEVLKQIEEFRYNVEINGLVEFGVLTGEHGSGKSHSLLHLKYLVDNKPLSDGPRSLTIYIDNPCGLGPKSSFIENYKYVLCHALGKDRIIEVFKNADKSINSITSDKILKLGKEEQTKVIGSQDLQNSMREETYKEVIGESPINYRIFKALAQDTEGAWDWLTSSSSRISSVAGENVQPLASHILCSKSLATIIKLATLNCYGKTPICTAVFVLVDQTEDLATLKAGAFTEQVIGWRTLLDEVERYFGMLWAMDGAAEDVSANFTDAIQRRQTVDPEKLKLLPLEEDEAKSFLVEVMKRFRKEDATVPTEIYPFTEDGLREAVNLTSVRIPSGLLNTARQIFSRASKEDKIKSIRDFINKDTVLELLQ